MTALLSVQPTSDDVQKSLRRFRNYAEDLQNSDGINLRDRLVRFVGFGKDDLIFSPLRKQLVSNPRVNIKQWLKDEFPPGRGWLGKGFQPNVPSDDEDRLSLSYQLLEWVSESSNSQLTALLEMWFGGKNDMDRCVHAFSNAVMRPLFRDLNDRLQEIERRLPDNGSELVNPAVHFEFHDTKNVQIGDFNRQDNRE